MKIYKLCLVISGLLVLNLSCIYAQDYMNVLNLRYYYLPGTELKSNDEKVSPKELRIETALPYKLKNGDIFGIKPLYKTFTILGNDSTKDLHLHSLRLPLFAIIKYKNPKWSMYFEISPKINSDFENITWNHCQIGATLLMFYEKKKDFFWQFGVYYNQETFGPYPMPLLGLDWKIDQKNYFAVLLPAYMIYERKLSTKFYTGFEAELMGETYRLGGSVYKNSYISEFGENRFSFIIEPRLFIDYYIAKHLVIYVKPGMQLLQKYEQYDENDNKLSHSDYVQGQLKDCFYVEIGIALRFRYDEEVPITSSKSDN
jgi:hypothetical protein